MTARGVLFDVDGTLVDTTYRHATCWHDAFAMYGHRVDMWRLHRAIGMGGDEIIASVLGPDAGEEGEQISTAHRVLYRQYWTRLAAFDSAAALLHACARRGLAVVLASSAKEEELAVLRSVLDADEVITAATSSSDADAGKPHPDIIGVALKRAGLDAGEAVFVGDSIADGQACARAEIRFVGVTCGGTSDAELRAAGAIEVWRDPAQLLDNLDRSALVC